MKWVRPLISIIALVSLTAGFFLGKVSDDAFIGVAVFVVTWWYKSRDDEKTIK